MPTGKFTLSAQLHTARTTSARVAIRVAPRFLQPAIRSHGLVRARTEDCQAVIVQPASLGQIVKPVSRAGKLTAVLAALLIQQ